MSTARASFETTIESAGRTATMLPVPLDVPALFGRHRPPVRVTVGGHMYRSTVAKYGDDYFLPLNRANREAAGVNAGDPVTVVLELDDAPRTVEPAEELARGLAERPPARATWARLSYSHRREYVEWIEKAKRPATRERRVEKALDMLGEGRTQR